MVVNDDVPFKAVLYKRRFLVVMLKLHLNPLTTVVAGEQHPSSSKGDVRLTTTIEETSIKGGGTSRRQVVNPLTTVVPPGSQRLSPKGQIRLAANWRYHDRLTTMIEGTSIKGGGTSRRQRVTTLGTE